MKQILLPALLMVAIAPQVRAAETYDAKSPSCEIPIFHWTSRPVQKSTSLKHILKRVVGAVEANTTVWNPERGAGDLAGEGMYFGADPISSQSYGDHLVIAWIKPNQPMKDVRSLNELDDPEMAHKAADAIRADNPFLVHTWISKLGTADAVVMRAKKNTPASALPLDLAATEVVVVNSENSDLIPWAKHADLTSSDTLGIVLQKYSDQIINMSPMWSSFDAIPNTDLVWSAMKRELTEKDGDPVGVLEAKYQTDVWESLGYCGEIAAPLLNEAVAGLKANGSLGANDRITTSCELKAGLVNQWRKTLGYAKYAQVHQYFYQLKRKLGIRKPPADYAGNVSVFKATCKPY